MENSKPWTPATIRENVDNWSLAGDAGLLSYLQNFSDNLTTRTKSTLANVDELFNSLTDTNIALANVTNEFMNLHHTQFIENRVYEEDEIVASEVQEIKIPEEKNSSAENIELMKKVMQDGLNILSKHFERVEVPNSDSEDESEGPSIIVRPKEFYMDRPLPYVIGSDEWNACDHIGLKRADSSESLEDEEQLGSDSSSMSLDPIKTPESTSESSLNIFSKEQVDPNLIAQDKPEKMSSSQNMFESSSVSSESENYQKEKVNAKFAAELASKLGNVVQDRKHVLPSDDDVYGRPTSKPSKQGIQVKKPYEADLFSNEPPPLDEVDESPLFGSASSGNKYMSSGGLFDDLGDEDSLWNDAIPKASKSNVITQTGHETAGSKQDSNAKKSTISRGLFDEDSDIDDIFSTNITKPSSNSSYLSKPPTTMPLVDNEPPSIENEPTKKKAVGGVPIFGKQNDILSKNLSKVLKTPKQASSSSASEEDEDIPNSNPKEVSPEASTLSTDIKEDQLKKSFSLFTDNEPKTDESQKFKGLFDDEDDDNFDFLVKSTKKTETSNDLKKKEIQTIPILADNKTAPNTSKKDFSTKFENPSKSGNKTLDSLFYDDEPPPLDDEIDQKESLKNDASKMKTTIDLFKEIDDDLFKQDLFKKEKKTNKSPAKSINIFSDDIFDTSKNSNSLFDEPPDMSDSEKSDTSSKKSTSIKSTDMKKTERTENKKTENIEHIKPDILKTENLSKIETIETDKNENIERKETKSKSESKILDDKNSENKNVESVKDKFQTSKPNIRTSSSKENIGKISHNLNINVGALLPGSVRPKQNKINEVKVESDSKTNHSTASTPNLSVSQPKMVKSVSFDEPADNVETLQSLTQERARIPVKRRPSTRRARQQAIRTSLIDDTDNNFETDDKQIEEKLQDNKISKEEEIKNEINDVLNGNSNEQSPKNVSNKTSFDDNDLFTNKQQEVTNDNDSLFSNEPVNIFNDPLFSKDSKFTDKNDIFNDSSETDQLIVNKSTDTSFASNHSANVMSSFLDDLNSALKFDDQDDIDDIFNINKIKKPKSKPVENSNKVFDDDSSDLFSDLKKNDAPKTKQNTGSKQTTLSSSVESDLFDGNISKVSVNETNTKEEKKSSKISLFDDDDEDDDLFKPIKKTDLKSSEKVKETKENLKTKSIPKKTSIFDDDSEDDLFGSGAQKKSTKNVASTSKSDSTSGKTIKKPSSKVVFDNPLMFNDD